MAKFKSQMLWENIEKGDLSAVHGLLDSGNINLEERNETGQTFLMVACDNGELNIVRELLEAGVDPNAVDNDNWSALLCAAKEGHLEIVIELLERDAAIEHRDMCGWTPLMWASYKGRVIVVQELLEKGANPNAEAEHNMTSLAWASGRGHIDIVVMLLEKGAKPNAADKYGTTPLIWAARKGIVEIVEALLAEGANADASGMNSWTPLLVATKGGYTEVVQALLKYDPNVNAVDTDGLTALAIAAKEGYVAIVGDLIAQGAYVNMADRAGDTILIHAVKGGYIEVVSALLSRHVDIDVQGSEGKTALYWAVEKDHTQIVKKILDQDPDLEVCTKDNDTALLRAVRSRNEESVKLLMEKGAKVSAADKRGDTPLHIAIRARSKRITELLLRNPRNSRLLYRPNKSEETPYKMDSCYQRSILTQIFGHRNLNATDAENLLGYEIYSSALADILSEPALITPISIGLYAKWGSGKSFLLGKLKSEMKVFTHQNIIVDDDIKFGWVLFLLLLFINLVIGETLALTVRFEVGLAVGFGLFVLEYAFLGVIHVCKKRHNSSFAIRIGVMFNRKLHLITLFLRMLFCIPKRISSQEKLNYANGSAYSVRFLFSDCTRLTSVGGEKSLAAMIATLCVAVEQEYGFLVARLFRVFEPQFGSSKKASFKCICCIPYFVLVLLIILLIAASIALVTVFKISSVPVNAILISFICVIGLSFITNLYTWAQAGMALLNSQKRRVLSAADKVDVLKIDGFMQQLKTEVDMMGTLVNCMDAFTDRQTRLVVVVDGLDSCEQDKVLQVLDTVNSLFSDDHSPFIVILAVDPHIIIKGIEQNLQTRFDSNVNGYDYLRNVVHLPFYLQSQGVRIPKQNLTVAFSSETSVHHSESPAKPYAHQDSFKSSTSIEKGYSHKKVTNKMSSILSESLPGMNYSSSVDLSNTFVKNDYFSDINPRSMRRLMNIVAVTARLLRAYHIEFNWHRLAAWINIIEQWPYRVSWIIYYFEETEELDDSTSLHSLYQKISPRIPASKDIDPLLEIDRNVRKLEAFLASKSGNYPLLNISDLRKFLGCTINLDPYLRKLIREFQHNADRMDYSISGLYPQPPPPPGMVSRESEANFLGSRFPSKTNTMGTPTRHPLNMAYANQMMQYGNAMPGMMPMPMQMQMMPPGPAVSSASWPTSRPSPQVFLKEYNREFHLSQMSVTDVSLLLEKLSGINQSLVSQYAVAIRENNITGLVLANCDMDELGKVMEMKFGDWQLFKAAILSLREVEYQPQDQDPSNLGPGKYSDSVLYGKGNSLYDTDKSRRQSTDADGSTRRRASAGALRKQSFGNSQMSPPRGDDLSPVKPRFKRNDSIVQQLSLETAILREALEEFTEEGLIEEMDGPDKPMFNISDDEGISSYTDTLKQYPVRSMSCPASSMRSRTNDKVEPDIDAAESDIMAALAIEEISSTSTTDHEPHSSIAKSFSTSIEKLTKPIVQALENRKTKKMDTIPLVGLSSSSSTDCSIENLEKNDKEGKMDRESRSVPAVITIESDGKKQRSGSLKSAEDYFLPTVETSHKSQEEAGSEYFL
ncbi:hypothetical protein SNE40_021058 [Patella caerulea]|uniref:KAP NTPase domain-containing protein n=1 Tax=Patella caerulea TaxID=87958 RepID=A0AAN8GD39_PATCE